MSKTNEKCDTEECTETATVVVSDDQPGSVDAWLCACCARSALTAAPYLKSWGMS